MRVAVSGASGFIGRALCAQLRVAGHSVVPLVRRPMGLEGEKLLDEEASARSGLAGCETVVHLIGSDRSVGSRPMEKLAFSRQTNVSPAISMARRAIELGVRRMILISTAKVNGETTGPGARFSADDPPAPRSAYGQSKWEAEQALLEPSIQGRLDVVVIRPPLVYGPGVRGNFGSLLRWVRSGIPLPFGAVESRRSMIGIENLVSFISLCVNVDATKNARGQVFLVSDGEDVSIPELMRAVAYAYGCEPRLLAIPENLLRSIATIFGQGCLAQRLFDPFLIDDSKAREMLGWNPPTRMEEQLARMAVYDSTL